MPLHRAVLAAHDLQRLALLRPRDRAPAVVRLLLEDRRRLASPRRPDSAPRASRRASGRRAAPASMNQMPSSGTTSSGGGSPTRHGSGATGHSSIVVPTSSIPSSLRSRLALVRQRRGRDLVLRREGEHRDEAGHRAAVAGEDPVAVAAQAETEPVAGRASARGRRSPAPCASPRRSSSRARTRRDPRGTHPSGRGRRPCPTAGPPPPTRPSRRRSRPRRRRRTAARDSPVAAGGCRLEAHARQPDRLEQPLAHVVLVRHPRDALDDDAEQREREVGVVEARAGREHQLGLRERLEQLVRLREPQASATSRRASRAAGPRRGRGVGGSSAVCAAPSTCRSSVSSRSSLPASRSCMIAAAVKVFVIEPIAVLRVGRRLEARLDVRGADRGLPDELAVAQHGRADARHALARAVRADESARGAHRAARRSSGMDGKHLLHCARSPARCPRRRCRDA